MSKIWYIHCPNYQTMIEKFRKGSTSESVQLLRITLLQIPSNCFENFKNKYFTKNNRLARYMLIWEIFDLVVCPKLCYLILNPVRQHPLPLIDVYYLNKASLLNLACKQHSRIWEITWKLRNYSWSGVWSFIWFLNRKQSEKIGYNNISIANIAELIAIFNQSRYFEKSLSYLTVLCENFQRYSGGGGSQQHKIGSKKAQISKFF